MKILLCHNYYQNAGGEDHSFAAEARLLEAHGHEVVQFTRNNRDISSMWLWDVARKAFWNSEVYTEARALLQRERPTVMHCTNTFPLLSPSVYYAARDEGVPVVQALRNYRLLCPNAAFLRDSAPCEKCLGKTFAWPAVVHGCYRDSRAGSAIVASFLAWHRWRKTWSETVNLFYTPSAFAREKFIAGGFDAAKIAVKPNFVDPAPGPGRGQGGFAMFAGRLSQEKGIETLLAAWRELESHLPLKIVGDGPLAPLVKAAAAADTRVEWLGQKSSAEVLELLGDATFLVYPSLCYETFGRAIVEAYSRGTPAVASRVGAIAELVEEGVTGSLFEAGNPADLARVALRQWYAAMKGDQQRQAALDAFEARFTGAANITQLLSIYARVAPAASPVVKEAFAV